MNAVFGVVFLVVVCFQIFVHGSDIQIYINRVEWQTENGHNRQDLFLAICKNMQEIEHRVQIQPKQMPPNAILDAKHTM